MQDAFDPRELYGAFQVDAEQQLAVFQERLSAVRARPPSTDDWDTLYRAMHTVRGGSALLGLDVVAQLADAMCQAIRRQRAARSPTEHFWSTLADTSRALDQIIRAALAGQQPSAEDVRAHVERLGAAPGGS
ncbi:MAG: Hpt domain-containing protein [Chloroflexi bacterium]|nr:Hpt domain-containing protein [Chloroflexota bacterium]